MTSREALGAAGIDHSVWREHLADSPAPHVYVYHLAGSGPVAVHARMFAPAMGITEDPATGAAAVALAPELTLATGLDAGTLNAVIHQGEEMGRPSRLELAARITDGRAASVTLGGPAVRVGSGRLRVGP